jgi:uncharacterized protein
LNVALTLVAVAAGSIAAVSGFGIGSLLTPVLMISMPTAEAVAVLAIPHAIATAVRWVRLRADVDLPTFKQFVWRARWAALVGGLLLLLGIGLFAAGVRSGQ